MDISFNFKYWNIIFLIDININFWARKSIFPSIKSRKNFKFLKQVSFNSHLIAFNFLQIIPIIKLHDLNKALKTKILEIPCANLPIPFSTSTPKNIPNNYINRPTYERIIPYQQKFPMINPTTLSFNCLFTLHQSVAPLSTTAQYRKYNYYFSRISEVNRLVSRRTREKLAENWVFPRRRAEENEVPPSIGGASWRD